MSAQAKSPVRISQRNEAARRIDAGIHRRRADFFLRALRPLIRPGESLLDVGAGDGLLISMLAQETGSPARGFDIEARELGGFPVEVYDGMHLPLPDQSVDVSICVAVLHHCQDAPQVMREIRRVTRKRFLLVEDKFDTVLDRWAVIGFHRYLRWVEAMPFDPRGFSSSSEWSKRLEDAGFDVCEVRRLGYALPPSPVVNTLFVCEPKP
jgi:ubiquinone/menaquinone biosynthesis C-methylase UbiE